MQFEVPQFIEIEDKIFGPFTWRQFLYLGGGLGFAAALFLVGWTWMFIFLGIPLAILGGLLAYYPVNNRPFSAFLAAIYSYLMNSRLYIWKRKAANVYKEAPHAPAHVTNQTTPTGQTLSSLAKKLELTSINEELEAKQ